MSRFKIILKRSLVTILGLVLIVFLFGYWFFSLIPAPDKENNIRLSQVQSIPYLNENPVEYRGRILAVVTSAGTMGSSGKPTGYELTELSRAYYVFQANGWEVDVASPKGGEPPVIIDDEDMGIYDYAFLNDAAAQYKIRHTLAMSDVEPSRYDAIYFAGGKGAMYDFPDNPHIQSVVKAFDQSGKVMGAVCHGPAALVNVRLEGGRSMLADRKVCGFTNEEELFLIPDAQTIFPFLLEDKLADCGAHFQEGQMYLENVVQDQNLITGQNPWSTWTMAETMVKALGYPPKSRIKTPEENTIQVLGIFHTQGYESAKSRISTMMHEGRALDRTLLAMHSIVAAMQWDLVKTIKLIALLKHAKDEFEQ
ncbi:type 1 glutamine amidotransferase domain-containing protein [Reichenbachiella ulvae]|uniref:Type 1 glutamine amidotransferase domain-containing protein n=1 Tax=Reichenbachiella ulvae TaxID=2980104 RepID=A0ABT3CUK2_9BACT|nr:type 1 glutamine amidotransferase domain-containing protein [Reichenbachiella ulvae]MCV9387317.1 type 1 glutamine amidotransferase domain-containing protein [Reichenbachiella ulvae]